MEIGVGVGLPLSFSILFFFGWSIIVMLIVPVVMQ